MSMRTRFYELTSEALDRDERVAVVLASIGAASLPRHPRVFDVGIREQLMIGVAAGLALEGALLPDADATRPRCVIAEVPAR